MAAGSNVRACSKGILKNFSSTSTREDWLLEVLAMALPKELMTKTEVVRLGPLLAMDITDALREHVRRAPTLVLQYLPCLRRVIHLNRAL